jgi:hypothetical protein
LYVTDDWLCQAHCLDSKLTVTANPQLVHDQVCLGKVPKRIGMFHPLDFQVLKRRAVAPELSQHGTQYVGSLYSWKARRMDDERHL